MKRSYKQGKVNGNMYYLYENDKAAILINRYSIHEDNDPDNAYLKSWYIIYTYEKNKHNFKDFQLKDYVNSCDYTGYELLPTLKESKRQVKNIYPQRY